MPVKMRVISPRPPHPVRNKSKSHIWRSETDISTTAAPWTRGSQSNEIYHLMSKAQARSIKAIFQLRESLAKASPDQYRDRFLALPVLIRHFQTNPPPSSLEFDRTDETMMEHVAFMTECLSCLAICLRQEAGMGRTKMHSTRITSRFQSNWRSGVRRWVHFLFKHFVESPSFSPSSSTSSLDSGSSEKEEEFCELVRGLLLYFGESVASSGIENVMTTLPGFIDPYARWWMRGDVAVEDCLRIGKIRSHLGVPITKLTSIQSELEEWSDESGLSSSGSEPASEAEDDEVDD